MENKSGCFIVLEPVAGKKTIYPYYLAAIGAARTCYSPLPFW
jgi:hypothetical protein